MKTTPFNWPIIGLLLLMMGIPAVPAIFILALVIIGPTAGTELSSIVNVLHFETTAAILIHGGSGIILFLTMPFQFSPSLRSKHPKLHKVDGRIALTSGYVLALSGVWMHHVLSPGSFGPRYISLVVMSAAMCLTFTLALKHILRGDVQAHRIWMCRAVAITLGVVTPLFVELLLYLAFNSLDDTVAVLQKLQHDYGRLLGMAINLAIVEYALGRGRRSRASGTVGLIGAKIQ